MNNKQFAVIDGMLIVAYLVRAIRSSTKPVIILCAWAAGERWFDMWQRVHEEQLRGIKA